MNTQEKLKLLLFDIIYQELDLKVVEDKLISLGVKSKQIVNPSNIELSSNYFFLMNDVHLENLSLEELNYINNVVDNNKLEDLKNNSELMDYLKNNKLKLLVPNIDSYFIKWDNDFLHISPKDAIVIALHYLKYYDEFSDELEQEVCNIVDLIQAKEVGYKVAILRYNEELKNPRLI